MPERHTLFKPTEEELRQLPKERAIRTFVKNRILSGSLAAGAALPAMQVLARLWGSNYFTVHKALTPLVQEGLLERHKGVGTRVAKNRRELQTVGIYYGADIISNPQHGYAVQLHRLLHKAFRKEGLKMRTWLDPRDKAETTREVLPELVWAIEHQHVQALVAAMTSEEHIPLLAKLSVPVVYFGNHAGSHNVYFPHREFLLQALKTFREQGRKNVAVIASPSLLTTAERTHHWPPNRAFEVFENLCTQAGVGTDRSWFHLIYSGELSTDEEREQIASAYEAVLSPKGAGPGPDALLIYPDNNLVTLHQFLAAKGQRLSEAVFILSHRNEPAAFVMPEGPHYLSLSLQSVAAGLVQLVHDAVEGRPCPSRPGELLGEA